MSQPPAKVSAHTVLVEGGRGGDGRVGNVSALHPQGAAAAPDLLFQLVEQCRVPEAVHQPDQPGQLEIWHLLGTEFTKLQLQNFCQQCKFLLFHSFFCVFITKTVEIS